jgi:hypothetical protein
VPLNPAYKAGLAGHGPATVYYLSLSYATALSLCQLTGMEDRLDGEIRLRREIGSLRENPQNEF